MDYKRILAVGDIHGMYDKLIKLMEQVQFNPAEDLLIFLGDYIDRGPQSLECVDYVMALNKQYPERVICLKGNHEAMCSNYYKYEGHKHSFMSEGNDLQMFLVWLDNGGKDAFRQFKKLKKLELQKRLRWMRMLPNHYQVGNYFFCHAGVEPYIPLDKQREDDLLWIRKWFIKMYHKDEIIVVGHTPVQHLDFLPVPQFLDNNIILCDTGSFMDGGKLSCVDVLSKKFWQA
ncbi:MAG: serine/threonine protein phosphatase [Acidaminococcaceae bacterium]|nr:serine/threonine protein phosphatase [Acidaminococcaceae bacterium]